MTLDMWIFFVGYALVCCVPYAVHGSYRIWKEWALKKMEEDS